MRILIINVAGIGDFFELIRWLYFLRKQKSKYWVDLLVSDRVYHYAKDCPYVDNVYFLKTSETYVPLNLENIFKMKKIFESNYSFIINTFPTDSILGDLKFMLLKFFLNLKSKKIVGAVRRDRASVYDINIYVDRIDYHKVFDFIGVKDEKIDFNLLWRKEKNFWRYYFLRDFILISPFSNSYLRNFDLKLWRGLIDLIIENYSVNIVLVGNSLEKLKEIYFKLSRESQEKTLIVSDSDLYDIIFLIENSKFVISVDTSIPHISNLLNKMSFVLVHNMDYEIHKPYYFKTLHYLPLTKFKETDEIVLEVFKYVNM